MSCKNKIASSINEFSDIASITPCSKAFLADIGVPASIIFRAWEGPISLGSLWVPPAPGNKPKLTSGSPTIALFVPMR